MSTVYRAVRPAQGEFAPYYDKYIAAVPDGDIVATLAQQHGETLKLLAGVSEQQALYAYEPGKWNLKEVLGHVIDAERIFGYRALCFARNSKAALPSMEQDDFAKFGGHAQRPILDLVKEFDHLRVSTLDLLGSITEEAWLRGGVASGYQVSVRALAWIIAGHEKHHARILRERYVK